MENNDITLTWPLIYEAVVESCSCGGKGPDDKEVCPACEVWHRLMGRAIKRDFEIDDNARRFVEQFKINEC